MILLFQNSVIRVCLFVCFFLAAKFVNEEDLSDVLCEFDAVMEDFTSPVEKRRFRYDEHLKTMKRRSSASVSDSGISDSESKSLLSLLARVCMCAAANHALLPGFFLCVCVVGFWIQVQR